MATVNLGRIKPVFKSTWANGTTYAVDDFVVHGNECYICIQAGAGQNPTSASAYWTKIAAKGTNGTNGTDVGTTITTQGDLLYRDGSGLQRLAKGTALQQLRMNSGATAPEWATVDGGAIKQIKNTYWDEHTDMGSSSNYSQIDSDYAVTITPTASNSSFWIQAIVHAGHGNNDTMSAFNIFDSQVGTSNGNEIFPHGISSGSRSRTFMTGKWGMNSVGNVDPYSNWQTTISGFYTPSSNNANARTFSVASFNPQNTAKFNRGNNDSSASTSTVSTITVWEIANGIYS